MNAIVQGWIEAANLFGGDSQAKMVCPECRQGSLRAEDIALPNGEIVEKRIYCDTCGAKNYVRIGPVEGK